MCAGPVTENALYTNQTASCEFWYWIEFVDLVMRTSNIQSETTSQVSCFFWSACCCEIDFPRTVTAFREETERLYPTDCCIDIFRCHSTYAISALQWVEVVHIMAPLFSFLQSFRGRIHGGVTWIKTDFREDYNEPHSYAADSLMRLL